MGPPSDFLPKQAEFSIDKSAAWQSQASPPDKDVPATQSLKTASWTGIHSLSIVKGAQSNLHCFLKHQAGVLAHKDSPDTS